MQFYTLIVLGTGSLARRPGLKTALRSGLVRIYFAKFYALLLFPLVRMLKKTRSEERSGNDRCDAVVNFGREQDDFVRLSREQVERINKDPDSPFKVPAAAVEAYVNRNKDSPRLAYWKYDSGNVGRAFSPDYRECRSGKKHNGVDELLDDYDGLLKRYEDCASIPGQPGEVCSIIYTVAKTGARIGSREDSGAELYHYERDDRRKPRRIVTGHIDTYGISTLRTKHVAVDGNKVKLDFPGKDGQRQRCVFESSVIADFFRRILDGKDPNDPVFAPHVYRTVYVKFKSDTGHTIKDLRTAMAHLIVPEAKKEWVRDHGQPANKTQEKKMLKYAIDKAAQVLGNKLGTLRKSYANPEDLKQRF